MSASTLLILICCCLATGASAYNSLFIGYSFFDPVAKQLPKLAEAAGQDHTQATVFSGGGSGTPIALWHDLKKSAVIKKALDTGKIELFGMPGWRTVPPPGKISDPTEGQDLWISYALSKNPKTKFMIGTAWEDFPAKYSTAAYASESRAAKTVKWWETFVAQLQAKHPGVTIIDNPYGLGAAELRLLYDAGVVKDVPRMFGTGIDDRANCMFYDEKGHGGNILHDLLAMFFLNRIYNVDLSAVDFSSALPWTTDLAKVAKSVLDAYDAGSVCGSDPCSPTAQLQLQPSSIPRAHAAITWAKGGSMCAGIEVACSDMDACTRTYFGPCESASAGAPKYLSSSFVGMAFVDEAGYLADASLAKLIAPDDQGVNGYRDYAARTVGGASYAYTMTGGRFGDMATAGGYMGIVSYLVTGDKEISSNVVPIRSGTQANKARRTDQGTGDFGAPAGPHDVCISEVVDGACGPARTFQPGEYKFSIFGHTKGSSYPPTPGQGGFPEYTHVAVRVKLEAHGFTVSELKVNGDETLATIGNGDVTEIELVHASGRSMRMGFPQQYNIGEVGNGGPATPSATKTVKIKVSDASSGDVQAMYLDYLFDASAGSGLDAPDKYFIYDPTVSEESSAAPQNGAIATTWSAVPVLVMAAAAVYSAI